MSALPRPVRRRGVAALFAAVAVVAGFASPAGATPLPDPTPALVEPSAAEVESPEPTVSEPTVSDPEVVLAPAVAPVGHPEASVMSEEASTGPLAAPSVVVAPSVSGAFGVGQTLTADPGVWAGDLPMSFEYRWLRCTTSVPGSCSFIGAPDQDTYTLVGADADSYIRVRVLASNADGTVGANGPIEGPVVSSPTNTSPPSISGTFVDGQTLTADPGTWTGSPTFTYLWRTCDVPAGPCVNIPAATASTYTLTSAEVGKYIRLRVDATNAAGASNAVVTNGPVTAAPPLNTTLPSTTGALGVGQTLTANPGVWSGTAPVAFTYQWRSCTSELPGSCTDIASATGPTYTLTPTEIGLLVRVRVTASNAAGSDAEQSLRVGPVVSPPTNTVAPSFSGVMVDGETLTADPGTWTGSPELTYRWRSCSTLTGPCTDIAAATGPTYTLTSAEVGRFIRVRVDAVNAAGASNAAGTNGPVAAAPPVNTTLPSTSGDLVEGEELTADPGIWSGTAPVAFTYQWRSCTSELPGSCTDIASATGPTYTLTAVDAGLLVRVRVTASNAGGSSSVQSLRVGPVLGAPVAVDPPVITGDLLAGSVLSADTGTWDPSGGTLTFSYEWALCPAPGDGPCTPIIGATSDTYTLTPGDVGEHIQVVVTASNAAGSSASPSVRRGPVAAVAPTNVDVPVITGVHQVGEALSVSNGSWNGTEPLAFSYVWSRCDADGCVDLLSGSSTHVLGPADAGFEMRATVTASNPAGSASTSSTSTATVIAAPSLSVDDTTPTAGDDIVITGTGFDPGTVVEFTLFSTPTPMGSVLADASGGFVHTATIPADMAPGAHTVNAVGSNVAGSAISLDVAVTVVAQTDPTPPTPPAPPAPPAPPSPGPDVAPGPGGSPPGDLARTGTSSSTLTMVALALLFAGAVALVPTRRRRSR